MGRTEDVSYCDECGVSLPRGQGCVDGKLLLCKECFVKRGDFETPADFSSKGSTRLRKQLPQLVILVGIVLLVLAGLFPPWSYIWQKPGVSQVRKPGPYAFLLAPPTPAIPPFVAPKVEIRTASDPSSSEESLVRTEDGYVLTVGLSNIVMPYVHEAARGLDRPVEASWPGKRGKIVELRWGDDGPAYPPPAPKLSFQDFENRWFRNKQAEAEQKAAELERKVWAQESLAYGVALDTERLFLQWALIAGISLAVFLLLRRFTKRAKASQG